MERKGLVIIMNEDYPYLALVRILRKQDGAPVGVGFLISPSHVITCAHVVNSALGLDEKSPLRPSESVTLDFPLTESNKSIRASVQKWHPVKEHPRPGLTVDIAVLEIKTREIPEGVRPVSFSKISEMDICDAEVRICGFPLGYDNSGFWSNGTIRGKTGDGRYQIDHDPEYRGVTRGFSGAPVWDKQDWTVVGMIVSIVRGEGRTPSYIIPISAILNACQGIDLHVKRKPEFGRIIPKMCNRERQDRAFWDFFRRRYGEFPNQPQFYICYGEEGECHRSLIERLVDHRIKSYFRKKWKKSIVLYQVYLSCKFMGSLKSNKDKLVRDLIEKLEPGYMYMDDSEYTENSIKTLLRLPVLKRYQLFIIVHDIPVSQWNKNYSAIIEWYMKDYWGSPVWPDDLPQFLIFLNIRYTGRQDAGTIAGTIKRIFRWDRFLLRGIEKALICVRESVGESCLLFDPLEPIDSNDVRSWFFDNMANIDESEMMDMIRSVFKGKQRVCMAKIEKAIKEVYQHYLQDISGLYE